MYLKTVALSKALPVLGKGTLKGKFGVGFMVLDVGEQPASSNMTASESLPHQLPLCTPTPNESVLRTLAQHCSWIGLLYL